MFSGLKSMECNNAGFNLHLGLYNKAFNTSTFFMNAELTNHSGRGVLAHVRNQVRCHTANSRSSCALCPAHAQRLPLSLCKSMYSNSVDLGRLSTFCGWTPMLWLTPATWYAPLAERANRAERAI